MPQNEGFYVAAYVAAVAIYVLYAWSIFWRRRMLRRARGLVPPQP